MAAEESTFSDPDASAEAVPAPIDKENKESRYRLILDSALDAIVTMSENGSVVDWNRRAEQLFGWKESEAVGRSMSDLIIPHHLRGLHQQGLERFLSTGYGPILNRRLEVPALRRDGREFPVELTVAAARIGDRWMFTAFLRDLSEQKASENRAYLQHECTRMLAMAAGWREAVPMVIMAVLERTSWEVGALWRVDGETGLLACEDILALPGFPATERIEQRKAAGIGPGEGLLGQAMVERQGRWIGDLSEEDVAAADEPLLEAGLRAYFAFPVILEGRIVIVMEFASREPRAEDRLIGETLVSLGGQLGQFIQRRRVEQELRESRERLALVFDNVNDAVCLFTVEGKGRFRCIEANRIAQGSLGRGPRDVLGRTMDELMSASEYPEWLEKAQKVAAGRRRLRIEAESSDGRAGRRIEEQTWLPIIGRAGLCTHILVIMRDVTEAKVAEAAMRQAQKMEAVGRLAGGIAHDFNNLLTVINGYCDIGLGTLSEDHPFRPMLSEVKASGERAARLTRQLLAFSRKQILSPQVLDLNRIVADMAHMLRRLLGENVEVAVATGTELRKVRVDPGQMEQVILNLSVNARDAMPRGGRLTLETANVDLDESYATTHLETRPGPHVMLAVSDTGAGMPPEVKARIFEPFFTTKPAGKGTGMGLATVYGIVKQSGGSINVYSEPGRGTVFKIYFPAVPEAEQAIQEPEHGPGGAFRHGSGETVLLAEDDDAVRTLVARTLERRGWRVLEARNAEEAEAIAARELSPILLLLTDVVMPGAGGRTLARRIARAHPEAKVLFMSGYTDNAIVHNGELEPGTAFLQKPFSPDALERKIRELLGSLPRTVSS
jgi:PAS domain S-box-containing protein